MSPPVPDSGVRRFFVAHMQKTAGTTLRDRLRATFSEEQIYPNRSDGPDPRRLRDLGSPPQGAVGRPR